MPTCAKLESIEKFVGRPVQVMISPELLSIVSFGRIINGFQIYSILPVRPDFQIFFRWLKQQVNIHLALGITGFQWWWIIINDPTPVPGKPMLLQRSPVSKLTQMEANPEVKCIHNCSPLKCMNVKIPAESRWEFLLSQHVGA